MTDEKRVVDWLRARVERGTRASSCGDVDRRRPSSSSIVHPRSHPREPASSETEVFLWVKPRVTTRQIGVYPYHGVPPGRAIDRSIGKNPDRSFQDRSVKVTVRANSIGRVDGEPVHGEGWDLKRYGSDFVWVNGVCV